MRLRYNYASCYAQRIAEIVPDLDPAHVEAFMRLDRSTLDALTREQFRALALDCAIDVRAEPETAEQLADSFGWITRSSSVKGGA